MQFMFIFIRKNSHTWCIYKKHPALLQGLHRLPNTVLVIQTLILEGNRWWNITRTLAENTHQATKKSSIHLQFSILLLDENFVCMFHSKQWNA
jgi:hypothetical protein